MKLDRVLRIFHSAFADEPVRVVGGYPEPFYRAPQGGAPAEIRFNRDYLNSCLHEISHWCIAGRERRERDDYGYWYRPDGRNGSEQREFFRAEAGPQALEWSFALACGETFRMSLDNLGGEVDGEAEFAAALEGKLAGYLEAGFPPRAERFLRALMAEFQPAIGEGGIAEWIRSRKAAGSASAPCPAPCPSPSSPPDSSRYSSPYSSRIDSQ